MVCIGAEAAEQLQLEVFVNGAPTNKIGAFVSTDGHLSAAQSELEELGLAGAKGKSATDMVALDGIAGFTYRYDEAGQRLYVSVGNELRSTISYDASPAAEQAPAAQAGYGAVLNYDLFAASQEEPSGRNFNFDFNGVSATLDGRAFSPLGTLSQSAILRMSAADDTDALRLDTAFTRSDQRSLVTYQAGDAISGGFAWTRPIRLGGLQVRRNFGLRTDLITQPLASVGGSAAVPSTVDVYVNNLKTFSRDIDPGPFRITNIPSTSGSGEARVVLRDAAGHEEQATLPFYASPSLLRPGLFDFSAEAGFPRVGYATADDAYVVNRPVGAASLRAGIFDWLTLEGHTEFGADLINGGAGLVLRTGSFGVASIAAAASHTDGADGFQAYAAYETTIGRLSLSASSQLTFGDYNDLASVTSLYKDGRGENSRAFLELLQYDPETAAGVAGPAECFKPPKAVNRISLGAPLSFDSGTISASYVDVLPAIGDRSSAVSLSYSRPLPFGGYLDAAVFAQLDHDHDIGLFAGLSFPLGGNVTAATAVSSSEEGTQAVADVTKSLGLEPGSVGWRVSARQGEPSAQSAAISYRSRHATIEAAVGHASSVTTASAEINGAVAMLGSDLFLTDRIEDSFAVVETGVADVPVLFENRQVGVTDRRGRLVVSRLRAYQKNQIAIDSTHLPVDASVEKTQTIIAPADRAGVHVDFAVRTEADAAVVILTDRAGKPIAVGSHGETGGSEFVVGYDGRAYVQGLGPRNVVTVTTASGSCSATFNFVARAGEQVVIPVTCQ